MILGLTAAGFDARDVGGYDLTLTLGDFEKTIWQGINGWHGAVADVRQLEYGVKTCKTSGSCRYIIEKSAMRVYVITPHANSRQIITQDFSFSARRRIES